MLENQKLEFFTNFEPAQLFKGSVWYVQYKIENPFTGELARKRIKINRIKNIRDREKYGKTLVNDLNKKLYNGWNPFISQDAPKTFTLLSKVLDTFLNAKSKELRKDSMRSYNSKVGIMKRWLDGNSLLESYCGNFGKSHALSFLNQAYNQKNISSVTFNNYVTFFRLLWNWMIEQQYTKANPFETIKKKKTQEKTRTIIPSEQRIRIKKHLEENDLDFYVVMLLLYHCLIRPKEVTLLKPEYFNLNNQTIFIPGTVAKNRKGRSATIPDNMMDVLIKYNFNNASTGQYIFGKNWIAGNEPINVRRFGKKWDRVRNRLSLPKEMQFYSLRDTGIVQMIKAGISMDEIMKQADHSSLEITTKYARHFDNRGSQEIKGKSVEF